MTYTDELAEYIESELFQTWESDRAEIQTKWQRNREAYSAITSDHWAPSGEKADWQSEAFIGKTHQKVYTFYSIVVDLMLRDGEIPYSLSLDDAEREKIERLPPDVSKQLFSMVDDNIDRMHGAIDSQFKLGKASESLMKCILSAGLYSETWAKRRIEYLRTKSGWRPMPVPGVMDTSRIKPDAMGWQRYEEYGHVNQFIYVPVWDIFRDMSTDEPQEMHGIIHRKLMSMYQLRKLSDRPLYFKERIKAVVKDGAHNTDDKSSFAPVLQELGSFKDRPVVKEYHGLVPRQIAEHFEQSLGEKETYINTLEQDEINDGDEVEVVCAYTGNTVIGYARVEPGERPFFRAVCEETLDELSPRGIADNVETMQEVFNDSFRIFIDNKKLASNVMMAVKDEYIESKLDKSAPGLKVSVSEDCDDVRKAIQPVVIPDVGESIASLIALAEEMIDQESMIPKISQGLNVQKDTTAFEVSTQVEAAGKYIGSVIKNLDKGLIQPWAQAVYDDAMRDPNARGKGNFKVRATGFTSYQHRTSLIANLNRYLTIIANYPQLQQDTRFRALHEKIAELTDLPQDEYLLSPDEVKAEKQAEQQSPEYQLKLRREEAEIAEIESDDAKNMADAEYKKAQAEALVSKAGAEKAKAIAGIADAGQQQQQAQEGIR